MREFPPRRNIFHPEAPWAKIVEPWERKEFELSVAYLSLEEHTALRQADLEKIAALREALEELRMQAQVDARCGERTKDEKSWESLFHFERQKRIEEIDEALQATAPGEKPD